MENKQYTQEEVMQLLQNPDKAAEFKRNFETSNSTINEQEAIKIPIIEKESVTEQVNPVEEPKKPEMTSWEEDRNSLLTDSCVSTFEGSDEWLTEQEYNEWSDDNFEPHRFPTNIMHTGHDSQDKPHCRGLVTPQGKVIKPELNKEERELLEYCATHDIWAIIKEDFRKNPINYEDAQNNAWRSFQ